MRGSGKQIIFARYQLLSMEYLAATVKPKIIILDN